MEKRKKQICQTIIRECNFEGFAIELRAGTFLHDNFKTLVGALEEYKAITHGEDKIELEIASSLHTLELSLRDAIGYASNKEERVVLESALVTIQDLILEILWPDYLRDPQNIKDKWGL